MIIGLDVGGTHTDVVLIGKQGMVRRAKVPTDPSNLLESVHAGLAEVMRGTGAEAVRRVVLSTTLTTNAIATGKLAPVGVVVSGGPGIDPRHYRIGDHFYSVSGAIDYRGREVQIVDAIEVEAVGAKLRAEVVRHVAVVGKFSVRNPAHESTIRELLGDGFDCVVMGHRLSGHLNFPRRIATAYLNAAVHPLHADFYGAVRDSLRARGLEIPILVLKADGGTMSLDASLRSPGQTILSGPAASVMGAVPFAPPRADCLVLDIGGTTSDMAVLVDQVPLLAPSGTTLGGFQTLIRALRTRSIGIGGDSAVRVVQGALRIGPNREGPALAFGGPVPTPTDALVVLGLMEGGDAEAAGRGIAALAAQLEESVDETANRLFDQACYGILNAAAVMISEINQRPVYTVHEMLENYQVQPRVLLVLGGPAVQFAARMAALTDFEVRVVPCWQVANATGAALARSTCEVTLLADTEQGRVTAPEEDFSRAVPREFGKQSALELASQLLRDKALREGAGEGEVQSEVVEEQQFNMVRGFSTVGRNIRVTVQIKPGLISEYRDIAGRLMSHCPAPQIGEAAPASTSPQTLTRSFCQE